MKMEQKIIIGDCFNLIKELPDNSVDLILTSPPYADIINYGKKVSIMKADDYCDWLLPLFDEIYRVLKPSGSFIMNINDKCVDGYRNTYVYDLISRNNKETNLKLYDMYIWHKKNGIPNGSVKRFRNNTEFIFHFCKNYKQMKFYMDRVLLDQKNPNSEGKKLQKVRKGQMKTDENGCQAQDFSYREIPEKVRPDNVLRFSTAGASRENTIKHPAPFNKELPSYFINLLTDEGDLILDPFSGIGTTSVASKELNRNSIGFELNKIYADFSVERLKNKLEVIK
jgi:site-specific DNA-methyltransferase (adenine-specific)